MFKPGDTIKRKEKHKSYWWFEECRIKGVDPSGNFVVKEHSNYNDLFLKEFGSISFSFDRFDLVKEKPTGFGYRKGLDHV